MATLTEKASNALSELQTLIRGRVISPGDQEYETARKVWNGAVDHCPTLIAVCECVEDVQAAVRTAQKHRLPLSVRGGGYDWAGRSVGNQSVVVDMSKMRQVMIDPKARTMTIGGGTTAADVLASAAPYGLTAVVGTIGKIGVVGFTLAGGYGFISPKFGLGVDNLLAAEVVLADGSLVRADSSENIGLYWALRGGGGNFGVVTSMEIRLHPVEKILAGKVLFPWSNAKPVLEGYAAIMRSAPDELAATAAVVSGPDGDPAIVVAPYWCGELEQGREFIARFEALGSPITSGVSPKRCSEVFGLFEPSAPNGRYNVQQTRWLADLTPEVVRDLIEIGNHKTSPLSLVGVHSFHGAPTRVPLQSTAFGIRSKHFLVGILASWEAEDPNGDKHRAWAREVSRTIAASALPGGYPNLLGPEEHVQIEEAYGNNTRRLQAVKRRFDPEHVFRATPLPVRQV